MLEDKVSNLTKKNNSMEIKKSDKANLENKKLMFLEIGCIIALLIVFVAFEWTTKETSVDTLVDDRVVVEEEEVFLGESEGFERVRALFAADVGDRFAFFGSAISHFSVGDDARVGFDPAEEGGDESETATADDIVVMRGEEEPTLFVALPIREDVAGIG